MTTWLVAGSREADATTLADVAAWVAALPDGDELLTGGARGVDQAAEAAARARGLRVTTDKPDWRQGKHAGLLRNQRLVRRADAVALWWDGQSTGTKHTLDLAQKAGKLRSLRPANTARLAQQAGLWD